MGRLLLIRHGETAWNAERRWQGQTDVPLADAGRAQATALAGRLALRALSPVAIYSSDLRRAWETATPVAEAFDLDPIAAPAWREINLGSWSGSTVEQIRERFPVEWQRITAGEDLPRGGGETLATFSRRVTESLEEIAARHSRATALVVTHGGAIRVALLYVRGWPLARLRDLSAVGNAAVVELEHGEQGWTELASA